MGLGAAVISNIESGRIVVGVAADYLEKAFDGKSYKPKESLPVAKELGETSLMFQVRPTITEEQMEHVCSALKNVLTKIITEVKLC